MEPRVVLDATFDIAGQALTLNAFNTGSESLSISSNTGHLGAGVDAYTFTLLVGDGSGNSWNSAGGDDEMAGLVDADGATLYVAKSYFNTTLTAGLTVTGVLNQTSFSGNLDFARSISISGAGNISTGGGTLSVTGAGTTASFTSLSGAISLGNDIGDTVNFDSLTFNAGNAVIISEDSSMNIGGASTAGNGLTLSSTSGVTLGATVDVTGNTSVTAGGAITVDAQLNGTGTILLDAVGTLTVNAAIDPTTVTLQSDDDVVVNAAVEADDLISIQAGQDGTGSFLLDTGGSLTADNGGNTASIIISTGSTSGSVTLTGTTTADDTVTIISVAGSINGGGLVTAATIDLNAATGIGDATALELTASAISADTTTGAINVDNAATAATTVSSLSTATGMIQFDQFGNQTLTITSASTTTDGAIVILNTGANLTVGSITAAGAGNVGLTTVTSGNILVGSVTADGSSVNLISAGGIQDAQADTLVDVTTATLYASAAGGIGNSAVLETAVTSLELESVNGSIVVDNTSAAAVVLVNAAVSGTGSMQVSQAGGGAFTITKATTTGGSITLSNTAANLTVSGGMGTGISAAGTNEDVTLRTITSGNVILTGTTTAAHEAILMSAGSISGTGLVTAASANLDAGTGIDNGGVGRVNLAANSISADTTTGNVDIMNTATGAVAVSTLTTTSGHIQFVQSGNVALSVTTATSDTLHVIIQNAAGSLSATTVRSTNSNVDLSAADDIDVGAITGTAVVINSANGRISELSPDAGIDVTGGTISLIAETGIGVANFLETRGTSLTLESVGGNINVTNDNSAAVTLTNAAVTTGAGSIHVEQMGGGTFTITSATAASGSVTLSNNSANLIVSGSVSATGSGEDAVLNTGGGTAGVVLTGTVFASDDVSINTGGVGTVTGSGLITANDVILSATALGASGTPITFNANSLTTNTSSANGNQFLNEMTPLSAVAWNTSTAGTGTITLVGGVYLVGNLQTITASMAGSVVVANGATLGGIGAILGDVTVNAGGRLAPGNSPGTLMVGDTTLAAGSTFTVEINGDTPGTEYDQLGVTGTVNLGGATLDIVLGYVPIVGDSYRIIDNNMGDDVVGTFAGLDEGEVFTADGYTFQITYSGGSGNNDVVLTAVDSANPTIAGTAADDDFVVSRNGTNVEVRLGGNLVFSGITTTLTLDGLAGDDVFTIDYTNGLFDVTVHGGTGMTDNDELVVMGGTFTTAVHTFTTTGPENSGNIVYTTMASGAATITYDGLEPVDMTGSMIGSLVLNLTDAVDEMVFLEDNGDGADGISQIRSANGTFELTTFSNSSTTVTVNLGTGTDNVIVNLPEYTGNLVINGNAGTDTVQFTGTTDNLTSLAVTVGGAITDTVGSTLDVTNNARFSGSTITLGGGDRMTTFGSLTFNSAGGVTIQEDGTGTEITGTNTALSLSLTSAGAVTDATTTSVTVTNAASISGTSIVLADTANDVLSVGMLATLGGGTIDIGPAGTANFGSLTFTSAGAVSIDENDATLITGTNTAGSLSLTSGGSITQTGAVSVTGTSSFTATGNPITLTDATNDFGGAVSASGSNISLVDANSLSVGTITATGTVDLTATTGAITDGNAGALNVSGTTLTASAVTGIDLDTSVASITASASGTGDVSIDDADAVTLTSVTTVDGAITISAGGTLTATLVTANGNARNVMLSTTTGNIEAGTITAAGDAVTLTASAGAITDVTGGEGAGNENVIAATVTLTAATGIGTTTTAGDIDTAATTLSATTATGGIFVTETDGVALAGLSTTTSGDIVVVAGGAITTTGDTTTAGNGNIDLSTTAGGITLSNVVTANGSGNVDLDAATLLTLNAVVSSGTGNLTLVGGTGVTHDAAGDLMTGGAGTIGVTATANDVTMANGTVYTAGTGTVTVLAGSSVLLGQITTSGNIGVTATAGNITDNTVAETANLSGAALTLSAATGIGTSTAAGDIDTAATSITASTTGTNALISLFEADAVELTSVTTTDGDISVSANAGTITALVVTAGGDHDALLTTITSGDIVLGTLTTAGTVTATGDLVTLDAAGAISDAFVSAMNDSDVVAAEVRLLAGTGIGAGTFGNANTINTGNAGGSVTLAATSAGGSINVRNSGELTIGTVGATVGVTRTAGTGNTTVVAGSPLIVNNLVEDSAGGNIVLAALGVTTADDLSINANITASGGNGSISLYAGDTVTLGGAGTTAVTAAGSGTILVAAGDDFTDGAGGAPADGNPGGDILMVDAASSIAATTGTVTLRATEDVFLTAVSTSTTIFVTADTDGANLGQILDNTAAETANLTANAIVLSAKDAIGIFTYGMAGTETGDIDVEATTLTARTDLGDIFVSDATALTIDDGGAFTNGLEITTGAGDILIRAGQTLTIDGPVVRNGAGSTVLTAGFGGTAGNLVINSDIDDNGGHVRLAAFDNLMHASGTISTAAQTAAELRTIELHSGRTIGFDTLLAVGATGVDVVMSGTAAISAVTGSVVVTSPRHVTVTSISSSLLGTPSLTTAAVFITADSDTNDTGRITDGSALESANLVGRNVVLRSAEGIGNFDYGTPADEANDVDVNAVFFAATTGTGDIHVSDLGGNVSLTPLDGVAIVAGAVASAPLTRGLALTAGAAGDDILFRGADTVQVLDVVGLPTVHNEGPGSITIAAGAGASGFLSIEGDVHSTQGDIRLTSSGDVFLDLSNGGVTIDSNAAGTTNGGDIEVHAGRIFNFDQVLTAGTGTANLVMFNNAVLLTDNGNALLTATNNIALQLVNAGTGTAYFIADSDGAGIGAIYDARTGDGTGNENVIASAVSLRAGSGIGFNAALSNDDALDLSAATVAAETNSGSVKLDMVGAVTIGTVTGAAFSLDLTDGSNGETGTGDVADLLGIVIRDASGVADSGLDTIAVQAGGAITVSQAVSNFDAGNITLDAAGAVAINAAVTSETGMGDIAGTVRIEADGNVTQSVAGTIRAAALGVIVTSAAPMGSSVNLLTAGATDADANDVDRLAISTLGGDIGFRDRDGFGIDAVENSTDAAFGASPALFTGTDIFVADPDRVTNPGVTATGIAGLDARATMGTNVGAGTVRLVGLGTADGDANTIWQTAAGGILAASLGIRTTFTGMMDRADVSLCIGMNDVDTIAANVAGAFEYRDVNGAATGTVAGLDTFAATTGVTATGLTYDVAGDLVINDVINVSGTVRLRATGSITQTATITADRLGIHALNGMIDLTLANDVNFLAAATGSLTTPVLGATQTIEFRDVDGLTIDVVSATGCFPDEIVGVTTVGADITIETGTTGMGTITSLDLQIDDGVMATPLGIVDSGRGVTNDAATVVLASLGGRIIDGSATVAGAETSADIQSQSIVLLAETGIGNFDYAMAGEEVNDLDVAAMNLTARTATGDIFVSTAGALTIVSHADVTLPSGTTETFPNGLEIEMASGGDILVRADGNLTVDLASNVVQSATAGTVTLAAGASGGAGDLAVNSAVTSINGAVRLVAQEDVDVNAAGSITTTGGAAEVHAGRVFNYSQLLSNGSVDGDVTMASASTISTTGGHAILTATNDVTLSHVNAGAGVVYVVADSDQLPAAMNANAGTGAIIDGRTGEVAGEVNITAASASLRAGSGIGDADDIDLAVTTVAALTDSGNIRLASGTDLTVGTVGEQDFTLDLTDGTYGEFGAAANGNAASLSGVTISDREDAGTDTANSGADVIDVNVTGTLTVDQAILNLDGGNVGLTATTEVTSDTVSAMGNIATIGNAGNITIAATTLTLGAAERDIDVPDTATITFANVAALQTDGQGSGTTGGNIDLFSMMNPGVTNVVLSASTTTIDTEYSNDGNAGAVLFNPTGTLSANAAGLALSIDSSTAFAGATGGNIDLYAIDDTFGGFFVTDIRTKNDAAVAGTLSLHGSVLLGNAADASASFTHLGGTARLLNAMNSTLGLNASIGLQVGGGVLIESISGQVIDPLVMGLVPSDIVMQDGTSIVTFDGDVTMRATGDVVLSQVVTLGSGNTVVATADAHGLLDDAGNAVLGGELSDGLGAIFDNLSATFGMGGSDVENIVADNIALRAGSGIGTFFDELDVTALDGSVLLSALTHNGLDATFGIFDFAINIVGTGDLTIGTVDGMSGVTVTDGEPVSGVNDSDTVGGADSLLDGIFVAAAGDLVVNEAVVTLDGGSIVLGTFGVNSTTEFNARVVTLDGDGVIQVGGTSVRLNVDGRGTINVPRGLAADGTALATTTYDNVAAFQTDGQGPGTTTNALSVGGSVDFSFVQFIELGADTTVIDTEYDDVAASIANDGNAGNVVFALSTVYADDDMGDESLLIDAHTTSMDAAGGDVDLGVFSNIGSLLAESHVFDVTTRNDGAGAGGELRLHGGMTIGNDLEHLGGTARLLNAADSALATTASVTTLGTGHVVIESITGLTTDFGGTTVASDIEMQDGTSITTTNGNVLLRAANDVLLSSVTAGGMTGTALVTADATGVGTAGTAYFATTTLQGGVASDGLGGITDNTVLEDANVTAENLILRAGSGIGNFDASLVGDESDDIDTNVTRLGARTGTGDIFISELAGLRIEDVTIAELPADDLSGAVLGGVRITALLPDGTTAAPTDGDILVREGGLAGAADEFFVGREVRNSGTGHVTLAAFEDDRRDILMPDPVALTHLVIDADVTTSGGDVRLFSETDVRITTAGTSIATNTGDAIAVAGRRFDYVLSPFDPVLTGDDAADIRMESGTLVATSGDGLAGDVLLHATRDAHLAQLNAGLSHATVVAGTGAVGGEITDVQTGEGADGATGVNILASQAALFASTGIGSASSLDGFTAIDLNVGTVAASTISGDLKLDNVGDLTIGSVSGVGRDLFLNGIVSTFIPEFSGLAISDADGVEVGDEIAVQAQGAITVEGNVSNLDAGNITFRAIGGEVTLDAAVTSETGAVLGTGALAGTVRIEADGDVTQTAAGVIRADVLGVNVFGAGNNVQLLAAGPALADSNDVNSLSIHTDGVFMANLRSGDIGFADRNGFTIDDVASLTDAAFDSQDLYFGTAGLNARTDAGNIAGNNVAAGDIRLMAGGTIDQTTTGAVLGNQFRVDVSDGNVDLAAVNGGLTINDVDELSASVTGTAAASGMGATAQGSLTYADANDLVVGLVPGLVAGVEFGIFATNDVSLTVRSGVAEANADDSSLFVEQFVSAGRNITLNSERSVFSTARLSAGDVTREGILTVNFDTDNDSTGFNEAVARFGQSADVVVDGTTVNDPTPEAGLVDTTLTAILADTLVIAGGANRNNTVTWNGVVQNAFGRQLDPTLTNMGRFNVNASADLNGGSLVATTSGRIAVGLFDITQDAMAVVGTNANIPTAAILVSTEGGNVILTADTNVALSEGIQMWAGQGAVIAGPGSTIDSGAGRIELTARGDIELDQLASTSPLAGAMSAVRVATTEGQIVDAKAAVAVGQVTSNIIAQTAGSVVTLQARDGIGVDAADQRGFLDLAINALNASVTAAGGGIFAFEQDGIVLQSLATVNGDITIVSNDANRTVLEMMAGTDTVNPDMGTPDPYTDVQNAALSATMTVGNVFVGGAGSLVRLVSKGGTNDISFGVSGVLTSQNSTAGSIGIVAGGNFIFLANTGAMITTRNGLVGGTVRNVDQALYYDLASAQVALGNGGIGSIDLNRVGFAGEAGLNVHVDWGDLNAVGLDMSTRYTGHTSTGTGWTPDANATNLNGGLGTMITHEFTRADQAARAFNIPAALPGNSQNTFFADFSVSHDPSIVVLAARVNGSDLTNLSGSMAVGVATSTDGFGGIRALDQFSPAAVAAASIRPGASFDTEQFLNTGRVEFLITTPPSIPISDVAEAEEVVEAEALSPQVAEFVSVSLPTVPNEPIRQQPQRSLTRELQFELVIIPDDPQADPIVVKLPADILEGNNLQILLGGAEDGATKGLPDGSYELRYKLGDDGQPRSVFRFDIIDGAVRSPDVDLENLPTDLKLNEILKQALPQDVSDDGSDQAGDVAATEETSLIETGNPDAPSGPNGSAASRSENTAGLRLRDQDARDVAGGTSSGDFSLSSDPSWTTESIPRAAMAGLPVLLAAWKGRSSRENPFSKSSRRRRRATS